MGVRPPLGSLTPGPLAGSNRPLAHTLISLHPNLVFRKLCLQRVGNMRGNQLYGGVGIQHVHAAFRQSEGEFALVGFVFEGDVRRAVVAYKAAGYVFLGAYVEILPQFGPAVFQVVVPVAVAVDADGGAVAVGDALAVAQVFLQARSEEHTSELQSRP